MAQVRQHANALLTPRQRLAMVEAVVGEGWPAERAAELRELDRTRRVIVRQMSRWGTSGSKTCVRRRAAPSAH
jgi:hypothetical protein